MCKHPTGDSRGFGFVTFATKGSGHVSSTQLHDVCSFKAAYCMGLLRGSV